MPLPTKLRKKDLTLTEEKKLGEGSFGVLPCGWMYSVDGNYPPKPAGEYILKDKNEVIWEFVK